MICVGVVSGLLMGCATNNDNNGTKRNNVSPVRYNNDDRNVNPRNVNYNNDLVDNNNANDLVNDNNNINNNGNVNNKMRVADKAADKVAKLKEVDRANVIVTDNNAYVAVMLTDRSRNELSKTVENKIAKEVRKADNDIDNVYVSVNPDFFDRMTDYGNDIRNGHPISGLFDQFNQTVQRIFPNAR
ncbi:YhcN/YlaJ family sporulation lipoprotein [Heyndrickxia vini]